MVHGKGLFKTGYELAKSSGAFVSGRDFIQRNFPPGYRDPALKLVRAFEQAATGAGLYQIVTEFGNAIQKPQKQFPPTGPFDQTRSRSSGRYSWRRRHYNNTDKRCRCPSRYKRRGGRNWR